MTSRTWILVAHRAGARVFENTGTGKGLSLKQDIPHPEGRLKNQDINSDRAGRVGGTRGDQHQVYENPVEPTEHVAAQFAKQLATVLDHGRTGNQYDQLVLVAEPRFLGHLRTAMSDKVLSLVSATVEKDLGMVEIPELTRHLAGAVRI